MSGLTQATLRCEAAGKTHFKGMNSSGTGTWILNSMMNFTACNSCTVLSRLYSFHYRLMYGVSSEGV